MRPGFLNTCLVSLYILITSAASPRDKYRDPKEHLPEVVKTVSTDLIKEPTCDELREMWRFSKRQSRAADTSNEIPTYRDPFTYNEWEDRASLRSVGGGKMRRPLVYGRLVHNIRPRIQDNTPERIRPFEEVARLFGTSMHMPKVHGRRKSNAFGFPAVRVGGSNGLIHLNNAQSGSFQHLKELIQSERARELHEQKISEENAARERAYQYQHQSVSSGLVPYEPRERDDINFKTGRSRGQLEEVVDFPYLLAPSKYESDIYSNINYMQRSYPDTAMTVTGRKRRSSVVALAISRHPPRLYGKIRPRFKVGKEIFRLSSAGLLPTAFQQAPKDSELHSKVRSPLLLKPIKLVDIQEPVYADGPERKVKDATYKKPTEQLDIFGEHSSKKEDGGRDIAMTNRSPTGKSKTVKVGKPLNNDYSKNKNEYTNSIEKRQQEDVMIWGKTAEKENNQPTGLTDDLAETQSLEDLKYNRKDPAASNPMSQHLSDVCENGAAEKEYEENTYDFYYPRVKHQAEIELGKENMESNIGYDRTPRTNKNNKIPMGWQSIQNDYTQEKMGQLEESLRLLEENDVSDVWYFNDNEVHIPFEAVPDIENSPSKEKKQPSNFGIQLIDFEDPPPEEEMLLAPDPDFQRQYTGDNIGG